MRPTTLDSYRLMQDGSLTLAEVEANGIRIDGPFSLSCLLKT